MKYNEIIDSGFTTKVAAEIELNGFDIVIIDMASLDDDGWQIRESYISKDDADDYIQVTNGDGYNGYNIAEQCGYPTPERTAAIAKHLGLTVEQLTELVDEIDAEEHLNSRDWSMLQALQDEEEDD